MGESSSVAGRPGAWTPSPGDDQRSRGSDERGTKCPDGPAIRRAVRFKLREVVNERKVDDSVGLGCAGTQAVEVFKRAAMRLRPRGDESLG
jgi:hypothetical protein